LLASHHFSCSTKHFQFSYLFCNYNRNNLGS
jgi:hypothetical protein